MGLSNIYMIKHGGKQFTLHPLPPHDDSPIPKPNESIVQALTTKAYAMVQARET